MDSELRRLERQADSPEAAAQLIAALAHTGTAFDMNGLEAVSGNPLHEHGAHVRGSDGLDYTLYFQPSSEREPARILRGADLRKLNLHPAIPVVVYAGPHCMSAGQDVLAVCEFRSLGACVRDDPRFSQGIPWETVLGWATQLASALARAHAIGLVHRNVTTHAIWPGPRGVQLRGWVPPYVPLTITNVGPAGSFAPPYCMSPELLMDPRRCGPPTDVYSLSAALFALLCGRHAFAGQTGGEVTHRIMTDRTPDVRERVADVPGRFAQALLRGMARDVDTRPSAAEFARALEAVAQRSPPPAGWGDPPAVFVPPQGWASRLWRALLG